MRELNPLNLGSKLNSSCSPFAIRHSPTNPTGYEYSSQDDSEWRNVILSGCLNG